MEGNSPREEGRDRWNRRQLRELVASIVIAALIVAGFVAWYLFAGGRFFLGMSCRTLYGQAVTAEDTAAVDRVVMVRKGLAHPITCGVIRRDSFPPLERLNR
jgi:hypothetical protein